MIEERLHNALGAMSSNGPLLTSMLMGLFIAVELGRIAAGAMGSPKPLPANSTPASRPQVAAQRVIDVRQVVDAHLFGQPEATGSVADPAAAPVSTSSLILAGIIATQDPQHGVAIISDGGPSKVYSVGDTLGDLRVHSVFLDRVLLDRNGQLEALVLPHALGGSSAQSQALRYAAASGPAAPAADGNRRVIKKTPIILDQVMRTAPSFAGGKMRGLRAFPGSNRATFSKLGLRPGDLLTEIDGTPLNDPKKSQALFDSIQSAESVTVTIDRGGQRRDIVLSFAQVPVKADAAPDAPVAVPVNKRSMDGAAAPRSFENQ